MANPHQERCPTFDTAAVAEAVNAEGGSRPQRADVLLVPRRHHIKPGAMAAAILEPTLAWDASYDVDVTRHLWHR